MKTIKSIQSGDIRGLIIFPAYNEASVIEDVIKAILQETKNYKKYQIDTAVVNDGSSDNTEEIAMKHPVIVLTHYVNFGSGSATRTGLEYAKRNNYDFAVTVDADGQHAPQDLIKIIKTLDKDEYDLVIGSRLINTKGMPVIRVFGNKLLNLATRLILGVRVTDSQSGLKAFSKKAINTIEIRSNGFEFCSEIVWRAKQQKLKIKEVPIKAIYTDYSLQKGQNNVNALRIIKNLAKQKIREV